MGTVALATHRSEVQCTPGKVRQEGLGLAQVRCSGQGTCSFDVIQILLKSPGPSLVSQSPGLMREEAAGSRY